MGEKPRFTPRESAFRVDRSTGHVKETHGVSVFDNPASVSNRGFTPHELSIIQRGKDPSHPEIVPSRGGNRSPQEWT